MSEELKPCPLCGKMPEVAQIKAGIDWWQVECEADRGDGCGLSIPRSTRPAAITAWNTRAHPAPAPMDAVREAATRAAWAEAVMVADSFCDESGDEVAGQIRVRARKYGAA